MELNKDFVPYEPSLEIKELGFDEPCFALYYRDGESYPTHCTAHEQYYGQVCMRPTYSQAFRWFRKKHNLRSFVDTRVTSVDSPYCWVYDYQVKMGNGIDTIPFYSGDFDTYEEAELACLKKLIEIVKNK